VDVAAEEGHHKILELLQSRGGAPAL
jgi:hypothetical protein